MRRYHLFEFEDLPWFPEILRRGMTRYLRKAFDLFPLSRLWAEKIAELAPKGGEIRLVDLGSGSGGALPAMVKEFEARGLQPRITLTDLYPDANAVRETAAMRYWPHPVDAVTVPRELDGIRTMFLSFHHHRPEKARAILRDAFEQRRPICIFEGSSRSTVAILSTIQIPVVVLFVTLLIRPVRMSQLIFTYAIPLLPLCIFWDGLVSHLRIYTPDDLLALTSDLRADGYVWEAGELHVPGLPGAPPWLIGRPVDYCQY